ncbi:MAG: DUF2812 domain-containing protein [Oscillospiraceae bacterium]|nr:DUF2812 domain-containing protein [Oscillospiraceae bacterium]
MRKTVHKLFWAWDFDKEEQWLNEMAAKGLCLISVGLCKYEFEDCVPGEYSIRLELLKEKPMHPESVKYMEFLEETGAEHVGSYMRWVYLRKKKADGEFQLFSDKESRIRQLTLIIRLLGLLNGVNLYAGFYNLGLFFLWGHLISLLGCINLALSVFLTLGTIKLWRKRQGLKEEQMVFE